MEPTSLMIYAVAATVYAAVSEIIGILPIKPNSTIQFFLDIGNKFFGK